MKLAFAFTCLLVTGLSAQAVNLAKFQKTSADSSWGSATSQFAVDGIVGNDHRWVSSYSSGVHWLVVEFPLALDIGSAHVYMGKDDQYPIADFSLQSWSGSSWVTIPGTVVSKNTKTELNLVFTRPVRTSKVRLHSTSGTARVRELALFPPASVLGYPLGTDVVVDLARQHYVTASSSLSGNRPRKAVDGFIDDGSRWVSTNSSAPHYLTIDLDTTSKVAGVQLHTGFGTSSGSQIKNFRIEYWSGTAWVTAPGGAVSNNTAFDREVKFSSPVSTSQIRLVVSDSGYARVKELVVLPATNGASYPMFKTATVGKIPGTGFDRYADSFYTLANRARREALTAATRTLGLARNVKGREQQFQILLNVRTDTYRVRSRATGLHLAVRDASKADGAKVVQTAYSALPHQKWRLAPIGSAFKLVNVWSGLVLDVTGHGPSLEIVQRRSSGVTTQDWTLSKVTHYPKKGLAGWEGYSSRFGASWNYNWGLGTGKSFGPDINFAPMRWGNHGWNSIPAKYPGWHRRQKPAFLMGFNEPDNNSQSNIKVDTALKLWPRLERSNLPLVSPGFTNAWNSWSQSFMDKAKSRGLRVNYTALHWYGAPSADGFMSLLSGIHWRYGKPLWVTEFSCVDWSGNGNWNYKHNYKFFAEILWRMENAGYVRRYSIFLFTGSSTAKRSNVFKNGNRDLTPVGELYAGWDGDTKIRTHKPYFIHNKATTSHMQSDSASPNLSTGTIFVNTDPVQWFLVEAKTANRFHVVSMTDGRRLHTDGTKVSLVASGTEGAGVEWDYVSAGKGWHHLDNVATGKRLRESGGTFSLVSQSTTWDSTKWFFIRPHKATPAPERYGTGCGSGRISWSGVSQAGRNFTVRLRGAPGSKPAVLLVSAAPASLPLDALGMRGCIANVDLASYLVGSVPVMSSPFGSVNIDAKLPTGVLGSVYLQFGFEQPGLNSTGLGATRGMKVEIVN